MDIKPCGHEWRNQDFDCVQCLQDRIAILEAALNECHKMRDLIIKATIPSDDSN